MAKQSLLQMINKVLSNLGESSVTATTSLSGLSLMVFNTLNELLYDIGFNDRLMPLETNVTMTLTQNVSTYAVPSDIFAFDRDSFRYDTGTEVVFYTPQRFDREYKSATDVNNPDKIYQHAGYWRPYPIPGASANGKTITYRAWKYPTIYSTDTAAGTSYMPEGFDLTLLADYVTFKILHFKQNEEAKVYYAKVFGDGKDNEGSLSKFKTLFRSPDLSEGSIMCEPMEQVRGGSPRSVQGY